MIELSLLGLHALHSSDGRELSSLAAQPKRFALLAYLAVSGGTGFHRRDSLAAMFWPEMDQFAARRALRNTLYHLREALGDGVIVAQGNDAVSIDPALLTCDVTRLAEAVEAGHYKEAVDYYRGELLAGVHVATAGEAFEEWLSRERLRVTDLVLGAIRALMEAEEQAGNIVGAAFWAQRACALAPFDESWLRRGMSLLDETSDTGGALRLFETFTQRLATEFGATPSAETAALAARIRNGGDKPAAPREPAAPLRTTPSQAALAPAEAVAIAPQVGPVVARRTPRASPGRRALMGTAVAAAVVFVTVLAVRATSAGRAHPAAAPIRVLVAVFENRTGDSTLQALGRMTQDWIVQGIMRTQLVDVVDPRAVFVQGAVSTGATNDPVALAHRTGAAMVVSGTYYRTGDTLLVQASVLDVSTGRIVRVVGPILSSVRAPVAALDELRSRVMTALASAVDRRAAEDLGGGEPPMFDAYRDYVEGREAFWHGDSPHAKALLLRAAHRDTAFTAALLAAASAAANSNDCPLVDSLALALKARSRALDHADRLTLQIADARCRGRNEEMLQLALERADLAPRNSSLQMPAAAAALWANRPARALEAYGRVNPAVDLAWNPDTTHFAYWSGVAEALHLLGRHREELDSIDRMPPGEPLNRVLLRGSALAALSRPTAVLALLDSALVLPIETSSDIGLAPYTDGRPQYTKTPGWVATWISHELMVHGDTVAARQAARRAVAWYRSRSAEERSTYEERLVVASSFEMLGEYAEAEVFARQLVAEDSTNVDFRGELAGLAAERGDTALADSLDRWLAAQPAARVSWTASAYRARVAALLGRRDEAVARAREAFDEGIWPRWVHQEPVLASLRDRPDFAALVAPRG